jgi:hypothetical protein
MSSTTIPETASLGRHFCEGLESLPDQMSHLQELRDLVAARSEVYFRVRPLLPQVLASLAGMRINGRPVEANAVSHFRGHYDYQKIESAFPNDWDRVKKEEHTLLLRTGAWPADVSFQLAKPTLPLSFTIPINTGFRDHYGRSQPYYPTIQQGYHPR